jgi:invasion protein IalB
MRALISTFASLALVTTAMPAFSQTATQTGQHNAWATYSYQSESGPVCYISSVPTAFNPPPSEVNHGEIFFIVSNKPSDNAPLEPSFRAAGYEFQGGSNVRVRIGDRNFSMFTQGGWAWVENAAEEPQLVEAMKAGSDMQVSARSSRPRDVSYTFSLRGVTAALNAIENCN